MENLGLGLCYAMAEERAESGRCLCLRLANVVLVLVLVLVVVDVDVTVVVPVVFLCGCPRVTSISMPPAVQPASSCMQ